VQTRQPCDVPVIFAIGITDTPPPWTLPLVREAARSNPGVDIFVEGCWSPDSAAAADIGTAGAISLSMSRHEVCNETWRALHLRMPRGSVNGMQRAWAATDVMHAAALQEVLGPTCHDTGGRGPGCTALFLDPDVLFLDSVRDMCSFYEAIKFDLVIPDYPIMDYYQRHINFWSLRAVQEVARSIMGATQEEVDFLGFSLPKHEDFPLNMRMPRLLMQKGFRILWLFASSGGTCKRSTFTSCMPWAETFKWPSDFWPSGAVPGRQWSCSFGRSNCSTPCLEPADGELRSIDAMLFRENMLCTDTVLDLDCVSPADFIPCARSMGGIPVTTRLQLHNGSVFALTRAGARKVRMSSVHFAECAKSAALGFLEMLERTRTGGSATYPDFFLDDPGLLDLQQ